MRTWHPTVLVLMSLHPLLKVLAVVRSSRRLAKMLPSVLPFVALNQVLLRLALPCRPRLLLLFLWATPTKALS
jgi:hypothetical protein